MDGVCLVCHVVAPAALSFFFFLLFPTGERIITITPMDLPLPHSPLPFSLLGGWMVYASFAMSWRQLLGQPTGERFEILLYKPSVGSWGAPPGEYMYTHTHLPIYQSISIYYLGLPRVNRVSRFCSTNRQWEAGADPRVSIYTHTHLPIYQSISIYYLGLTRVNRVSRFCSTNRQWQGGAAPRVSICTHMHAHTHMYTYAYLSIYIYRVNPIDR